MERNRKGHRTPEEENARGCCRSMARTLGSRLIKVEKNHVSISPCQKWPEGLITAFHGWVDLKARLEFCRDNPEYVVDGIYVYDADAMFERENALIVKKLLEDYPHDHPSLPDVSEVVTAAHP